MIEAVAEDGDQLDPASRLAAATAAAESCMRALQMLGAPKVNIDMPRLYGDLYAIRMVILGSGLTTEPEFEALCAEGRAECLRGFVAQAQAAQQPPASVQLNRAQRRHPA